MAVPPEPDLPLHYYVWHRNVNGLKAALEADCTRIELHDAHGRTPLMLATVLGHREEALELLKYCACILSQDKDGFTALHSALSNPGDVSSTSTDDFKYLQKLSDYEAYQMAIKFKHFLTTNVASKMATICDYYFEVNCQLYPSHVPLLKLSYYSDTLKVYISSNRIRVDTSVAQINGWKVVRGNVSFIITFNEEGGSPVMIRIDHKTKLYTRTALTRHQFCVWKQKSDNQLMEQLKKPIAITTCSPISIQPVVKGWFTKTHKTESLDGLKCQLYDITEVQVESQLSERVTSTATPNQLPTEFEYFSGVSDLALERKVTHSKGQMDSNRAWVTTDPAIPLTIEQNVLPILELVFQLVYVFNQRAPDQSWHTKLADLREFPDGFPVKLELPVSSGVLGLKVMVKFGNVQAKATAVDGVRVLDYGQCEVEEHIFAVPQDYTTADQ